MRDEDLSDAMRTRAKEKTTKLYVKMFKLLAVASPANGTGFLQEVNNPSIKYTSNHFQVLNILFSENQLFH